MNNPAQDVSYVDIANLAQSRLGYGVLPTTVKAVLQAARELQQAQVVGEDLFRDDYITLSEVESRLETLAEEYEWCDDESPHTITDGERAILIDFAHGILVDDMFLAMMAAHHDPNARGRPDKATPQSSAPVVGDEVGKVLARMRSSSLPSLHDYANAIESALTGRGS